MTQTTEATTTAPPGEATHEQVHDPHLAHHFDTKQQQVESSKLGMWVFLATELLMFGGLFCAYSIYRGTHPLIFQYGSEYLDRVAGGVNTAVLIASSFTMAWAVRSAQLGKQRALIVLLSLTFLGGCGFMGIKAYEYNAKFSHDLYAGMWNVFYPVGQSGRQNPFFAEASDPAEAQSAAIMHLEQAYHLRPGGHSGESGGHAGEAAAGGAHGGDQTAGRSGVGEGGGHGASGSAASSSGAGHDSNGEGGAAGTDAATAGGQAAAAAGGSNGANAGANDQASNGPSGANAGASQQQGRTAQHGPQTAPGTAPAPEPVAGGSATGGSATGARPPSGPDTHSVMPPAGEPPAGVQPWVREQGAGPVAPAPKKLLYANMPQTAQKGAHLYFQAYYLMTGLHALHVLIGMGLIGYLIIKAWRGTFSRAYFTPVDIIGLYWHLVDLIWIFLFPLLYLIG